MKLALIGPLPPLRGGISSYNLNLLNELLEQGHDVLPISYDVLYPAFLFPGSNQYDDNADPVVDSYPILNAWKPNTWLTAIKLIRSFGAERLIVQHWHPFFAPCLRFIARWAGVKPRVVIAHNVLPHEHAAIGRTLNPGLYRQADRVIVGANDQLSVLQKIAPRTTGVVQPHPVYSHFFAGREDCEPLTRYVEARKTLGIGEETPYFVHLGLVREYKGVDVLLRAVAQVERELQLDVIGEFYDDISSYQELQRELGHGERVRLDNRYLSDDEMALRCEAADAVVLPYRHATQSGIAMIALAAGAPVIATATGALSEIIREGENGCLAEPGDTESLVVALKRFLNSGLETWRRKRNVIAEQAADIYSWSALAANVLEDG
ncbi:glycosyltransferase [bacterium]|nr:glycosyltransferase [bacterium]